MIFAVTLSLVALALRVAAHPVSPLALAVAIQQFKNSHIVPDVLPTFNPSGLLPLNFTGNNLKTQIGDALNTSLTSTQPLVYIHGTAAAEAVAGGPFNVTTHKYTVMMIDGNYPGSQNPDGYNLHWLSNDWTYGVDDDHTISLNNSGANDIVTYAGPAPPAGTGPHRYIAMVFVQPDNFTAPANPPKGSGVALFNFTQYIADAGLGDAICATYFTVEQGQATVSVEATSSVDSTTLPQFTPTSATASSASHTGSSSAAVKLSSINVNGVITLAFGLGIAFFSGLIVVA